VELDREAVRPQCPDRHMPVNDHRADAQAAHVGHRVGGAAVEDRVGAAQLGGAEVFKPSVQLNAANSDPAPRPVVARRQRRLHLPGHQRRVRAHAG